MIVLDTNIISEVLRPNPDITVLQWLDKHSDGQLFTTTVTLAEIRYGLYVLPDGQRKDSLQQRFDYFITEGFEQRILSFDAKATIAYAEIMGQNKKLGHPMSYPDGQIAAITVANYFSLATRNTKDFKYCSCTLINPFEKQILN